MFCKCFHDGRIIDGNTNKFVNTCISKLLSIFLKFLNFFKTNLKLLEDVLFGKPENVKKKFKLESDLVSFFIKILQMLLEFQKQQP
jgi:hypothetical protein